MQKGWDIGKAVTTYSILTIGDGLVSQIPALLISITAGMIVTRVSASEDGGALGGDVGNQLLSQPKALMIAAGFMVGFALIPGFPKIPFLILAVVSGVGGFALSRKQPAESVLATQDKRDLPAMAPTGSKPQPKKKDANDEFSITVPLLMDVSAASQNAIDAASMNEELIRVRQALYHDLGVPFPGIHLRFNESLPAGAYKIMLHEVPIAEGSFKAGHVLAREKAESLKMLNIPFVEEKTFLKGLPPLWVPAERKVDLDKTNVPYLAPTQVLTYHLSVILKRYAADFVGLQETKYLLEKMEGQFARWCGRCSVSCQCRRSPKSSSGWCRRRFPSETCAPFSSH